MKEYEWTRNGEEENIVPADAEGPGEREAAEETEEEREEREESGKKSWAAYDEAADELERAAALKDTAAAGIPEPGAEDSRPEETGEEGSVPGGSPDEGAGDVPDGFGQGDPDAPAEPDEQTDPNKQTASDVTAGPADEADATDDAEYAEQTEYTEEEYAEETYPDEDSGEYGDYPEDGGYAGTGDYTEEESPDDRYPEDGEYAEDEEEEPENLAEVAERILGARHSRVSTAAPIRTRADREREEQNRNPALPAPAGGTAGTTDGPSDSRPHSAAAAAITAGALAAASGRPDGTANPSVGTSSAVRPSAVRPSAARPSDGKPAVNPAWMSTAERQRTDTNPFMNTAERQALREQREKAAAERRAKEEAEKKKRKTIIGAVAAACAVIVIGTGVGIGIGVSRRNSPAADTEVEETDESTGKTNVAVSENEAGGNETAQKPENGETVPADAETVPENGEGTEDNGTDPGTTDGGSEGSGTENPEAGEGEENPQETGEPADNPAGTSAGEEQPAEGTNPGENAQTADPEQGTGTAVSTPDPEPEPEPEPEPTPVRKFRVEVDFYNRDPIVVETEPTSVGKILSDNGITLKDGEQCSIGLWDWLTESVTCSVDLYEYVYEEVSEAVPYQTVEIAVDTIPRGTTSPIQSGVNGEKVNHYYVALKNGTEFDRRLEWEETVTAPQDEQYYIGVGGTLVGKDGLTYSYSWKRVCPATYYSTGEYTWSGNWTSSRTVAADFSVMPLGTKLYIRNDRYDFGYRVVEDTGGRLDPWQVDIWMDASDPNYRLMSAEEYVYDMVVYFLD